MTDKILSFHKWLDSSKVVMFLLMDFLFPLSLFYFVLFIDPTLTEMLQDMFAFVINHLHVSNALVVLAFWTVFLASRLVYIFNKDAP